MPRRLALTRQQAYLDYLALGGGRSLRKLRALYFERDPETAPSQNTLDKWSRSDSWAARAREHDEQVAEAVRDSLKAAQVKETWNAIEACRGAAERCLEKTVTLMPAVCRDGASGSDIRSLVSAALDLIRQIEVLEGRVSDRTATKTTNVKPRDYTRATRLFGHLK